MYIDIVEEQGNLRGRSKVNNTYHSAHTTAVCVCFFLVVLHRAPCYGYYHTTLLDGQDSTSLFKHFTVVVGRGGAPDCFHTVGWYRKRQEINLMQDEGRNEKVLPRKYLLFCLPH